MKYGLQRPLLCVIAGTCHPVSARQTLPHLVQVARFCIISGINQDWCLQCERQSQGLDLSQESWLRICWFSCNSSSVKLSGIRSSAGNCILHALWELKAVLPDLFPSHSSLPPFLFLIVLGKVYGRKCLLCPIQSWLHITGVKRCCCFEERRVAKYCSVDDLSGCNCIRTYRRASPTRDSGASLWVTMYHIALPLLWT